MLMQRRHGQSWRRGSVAPLVAICLIVLVGMAAFALDGGFLQDNRRRAQAAADAAAMAAATKLYTNYNSITDATFDPGSYAKTAAETTASDNGFPNNGTTSSVTVNIPPQSGPFTGSKYYAEIIVTYNQPRYFSTIWGSGTMPVKARAVAFAKYGGSGNGVIVLDPQEPYSLDANGNGTSTVTGGAAMIVNSKDSSAGRTSGGGSLTAAEFDVTGSTVGTGFTGPIYTGTPPVPDPLAYLPVPSVPPNGSIQTQSLTQGNHKYTLTPGRYTNLPGLQSGDQLVLKQASAGNGGIYYFEGSGFISQGASITMDPSTSGGVMIYNAPTRQLNNQAINITGNASGTVNLSALTSGPYAGILFWQERTSSIPLSISGNGNFSMNGTFYAANALMTISGNGSATIGSQYISRLLNITGGGNITINYTDNGTARIRGIYLVE